MTREEVLGAVRAALGGPSGMPEPERWTFPAAPEPDRLARFMAEAARVDAEVVSARDGDWASALRPFLLDQRAVFCGSGVDVRRLGKPLADAAEAAARPGEVAGLVRASHGIAESGTVVIDHDGDQLPSLLTEVSVVLLAQQDIVAGLEDLPPPDDRTRCRVLITGPSRTADIEKRLVLGAHGPRRLVVVIL